MEIQPTLTHIDVHSPYSQLVGLFSYYYTSDKFQRRAQCLEGFEVAKWIN